MKQEGQDVAICGGGRGQAELRGGEGNGSITKECWAVPWLGCEEVEQDRQSWPGVSVTATAAHCAQWKGQVWSRVST